MDDWSTYDSSYSWTLDSEAAGPPLDANGPSPLFGGDERYWWEPVEAGRQNLEPRNEPMGTASTEMATEHHRLMSHGGSTQRSLPLGTFSTLNMDDSAYFSTLNTDDSAYFPTFNMDDSAYGVSQAVIPDVLWNEHTPDDQDLHSHFSWAISEHEYPGEPFSFETYPPPSVSRDLLQESTYDTLQPGSVGQPGRTMIHSSKHRNTGIVEGSQPPMRRNINGNSSKRHSRIPASAKKHLEESFLINAYPSAERITELARLTDQEEPRVKNWFSNARSRRTAPGDVAMKDSDMCTQLCQQSLKMLSKDSPPAQQPPMDAYLSSSSDEEAASVSDIAAASRMLSPWTKSDSHLIHTTPPSITSSTNSSIASSNSMYSQCSIGSSASRSRRRGRRRFPNPSTQAKDSMVTQNRMEPNTPSTNTYHHRGPAATSTSALPHGPFYCTFCWKEFPNKYEWRRHELSVHVPHLGASWVCCPVANPNFTLCPFCASPDADNAHLSAHGYFSCHDKPIGSRQFFRKDQFIQHINNSHALRAGLSRMSSQYSRLKNTSTRSVQPLVLERWKIPPAIPDANDLVLNCGFCGHRSQSWNCRVDHVASHFDGTTLHRDRDEWWPQRQPQSRYTSLDTLIPGSRCSDCHVTSETWSDLATHYRVVYSCRYLYSYVQLLLARDIDACVLCAKGKGPNELSKIKGMRHGDYHHYRACSQELYTSVEALDRHLVEGHRADRGVAFLTGVSKPFSGMVCSGTLNDREAARGWKS